MFVHSCLDDSARYRLMALLFSCWLQTHYFTKQVCIHKKSCLPACPCPPKQKNYLPTDGPTDQPTDIHSYKKAWTQLKMHGF